MNEHDMDALSGHIFDETTEITIVELCEVCSVEITQVEALVDEGILEPIGGIREERRFPYHSVRRARRVLPRDPVRKRRRNRIRR